MWKYNGYYHHPGQPYLSGYFAAVVGLFAYTTIALSAMQLVVTEPSPSCPPALAITCYRFGVAALFLLIMITVILLAVTIVTIFIHWRDKMANAKIMNEEIMQWEEIMGQNAGRDPKCSIVEEKNSGEGKG